MNNLNALGKRREYWRVLPVVPGDMLVGMAQQAEDEGIVGIFAYQVFGPPFIPLAAAATVTKRIKLASGIAVAASRSPFETAMAARDLDMISGGRFILGLGSSIPSVLDKIYGVPDVKPLQHVRETVAAVRHIHTNAHRKLTPFNGNYYRADFSELDPLPPPVKAHLPIWLGALREKMTRLAAEVGDGLIGHPMWSVC
jgi:alkanesulfonate monooxygenase SsuD/methylene tetrahydromethanopterin reductase-like flavin-dependent oxidoreductase (luciferase family)